MILCTSGMVSSRDIIATYETKRQSKGKPRAHGNKRVIGTGTLIHSFINNR